MAEPHTSTHSPAPAAPEHHSAVKYIVIWIALLILTGATYTFAKANLGSFQLPVAMVIAVTKASLVVLFFMHLAEQKGANRLVFVLSIFFVGLMISIILADVATRFPLANPPTDQAGEHGRAYHPQTDEDVQGPRPQSSEHSRHH